MGTVTRSEAECACEWGTASKRRKGRVVSQYVNKGALGHPRASTAARLDLPQLYQAACCNQQCVPMNHEEAVLNFELDTPWDAHGARCRLRNHSWGLDLEIEVVDGLWHPVARFDRNQPGVECIYLTNPWGLCGNDMLTIMGQIISHAIGVKFVGDRNTSNWLVIANREDGLNVWQPCPFCQGQRTRLVWMSGGAIRSPCSMCDGVGQRPMNRTRDLILSPGVWAIEAVNALAFVKTRPGMPGWPRYKDLHPQELELAKLNVRAITTEIPCPSCGPARVDRITSLVIHLNDHHEWSRGRIAEWLEALDVDLNLKAQS